ncbi:putative homoserine O-acetyltransferase [Bradyrhizobium oligotrophicum S58]|uniref:Putative homoserine O-acetyltransferase n=1 Tax=Bradyrhizobium oligotrophicum S58 TaxID=1245469 RepID=M5A055_9BRAD|nr:alpha/beta fold hydrolase [Bradyrhizobium oligotrophicum]BAM92145.1 putative homoserine O-acetyltransferase [Bradyrhizobium oligotrophicum S58]
MTTRSCIASIAALLLIAGPAAAHTPQQPPHQSYAEGDLKLESGEVIRDFAISYVTHGELNAQKSNAILMVTAISGNHHRLDFMIGPGRALDTNKYFVICTDAIGNGLSTSPSNSKAQARMAFPKFAIRDMVESQYRLLKEKLGIDHVVAVVGPSMGGMQTLQWGVSHPEFMDSLVAIVPLAKTPAWSVAVMEASRKAIMNDPAWKDGNYEAPPEKGIRLWRDIVALLAARTPDMYAAQFKNGLDVLPWMEQQETALVKAFDADDWIYQTWAYDRHDVGTTPGFDGDTAKALASIKAKTLILTGTKDLLNPEFEPIESAKTIPDVTIKTISPGSVTGHAAASGLFPADVEFLNREVGAFLDGVAESGKRLHYDARAPKGRAY